MGENGSSVPFLSSTRMTHMTTDRDRPMDV